jgi:hypothetical protein
VEEVRLLYPATATATATFVGAVALVVEAMVIWRLGSVCEYMSHVVDRQALETAAAPPTALPKPFPSTLSEYRCVFRLR